MQDRSPPVRQTLLHRTAGPYIWVKSDHFGVLADVRYYPQSDRNSDQLNGRYVPLATKVQRS